jgi:hypothetical protein
MASGLPLGAGFPLHPLSQYPRSLRLAAALMGGRGKLRRVESDNNNNNTFTCSGPSGVLGCTGQRPGVVQPRPKVTVVTLCH